MICWKWYCYLGRPVDIIWESLREYIKTDHEPVRKHEYDTAAKWIESIREHGKYAATERN